VIRVFIGCPANGEDLESQAVLEYTLRKNASRELVITWMKLSRDPRSFWFSDAHAGAGWLTRGWATPFSAFRWGVPAACNFQGKAIYLDVDMIVMGDIAEFWDTPILGGAFCMAKNSQTFCCTLFDCARAKHVLPPIERLRREFGLYARQRRTFVPGQVQPFPDGQNWNCLDGEDYQSVYDPRIKILHCTSIPTQPQLRYALPRLKRKGQRHWSNQEPRPHWRKDVEDLFDEKLVEAYAAGYTLDRYETGEPFGEYHRAG